MAKVAKRKHYPKAPIVEATIQINFTLTKVRTGKTSVDAWAQVAKKLSKTYAISKPINAQMQQVSFGLQPAVSMTQRHIGFRLENPSAGYVIQVRDEAIAGVPGGAISITKLAPYDSWDSFINEVRAIWGEMIATKRIGSIKRLAVRYINRIDAGPVPLKIEKLFRIRPDVPDALDACITNFNMQLAFQLSGGFECALRQQPLPVPEPNGVAFLFDLDVHQKQKLPKDPSKIWNDLERLRDAKNHVFEMGITVAQKKKFL